MENINISNTDRIIRIVLGLGLVGLTISGIIGPWGWLGILVLMTALFNSCPAYVLLGLRSRSDK